MTAGLGARPFAPTALWLGAIAMALGASLVIDDAAVPVAAGGAVLAVSLIEAPIGARLLTALAMVPIAFLGSSPEWAWIGAGAAVGLATSLFRGNQAQLEPNGDLQRHLAWCRRREEPAHLLVAPLEGIDEQEVRNLIESFRITDSVTLGRNAGGSELFAFLDAHGFVREGLEARLAERFSGRSFGWATFPKDGVTLQTLLDHARATMGESVVPVDFSASSEGPLISELPAHAPALEHAAGRS